MVCTVDAADCEQTGSGPLCEEAAHKVQFLDPFCTAMVRMLKSEGNESPDARKAMAKKEKAMHAECRRWLPHLEVRGGMLYRVKTGSVRSKRVIGDPDLLQLCVPKGEFRQRQVKAVHEMLGHAERDMQDIPDDARQVLLAWDVHNSRKSLHPVYELPTACTKACSSTDAGSRGS